MSRLPRSATRIWVGTQSSRIALGARPTPRLADGRRVTHLLDAVAVGDRKAAADLLSLVYDELRKLAAARMAAEDSGHTLDATALVNEAWLKLNADSFASKSGFFRAAAVAMRHVP